jgi:hypothetical protein
MNDDEIAKLEDEGEWDFSTAESRRAPRGNRAIVSVGFRTDDFTLVAEAARNKDQPISQFIREAALDRARGRHAEPLDPRPGNVIEIRPPKIDERWLVDAFKKRRGLGLC